MARIARAMTSPDRNRTLLVTGAYPPDVCGVGDYTARLMAAAPSSWELFVERDWSWRAGLGIIRRLLARRPANVVIQYPTQGYGWSLVPHLLVFTGWLTRRFRPVLALHEFSSLSRNAQIALALASHAAAHIIFTTESERDRARLSPLFSRRTPVSVVGILSNIPRSDEQSPFVERTIDIAYFGHIRPNKGLDDFLDVVTAVAATEPTVRIALIGVVPKGYESFADLAAARCRQIGVRMLLGLDDEAVGQVLANVRVLYLPFPDGVSARRGSALAGLCNGAIVATRIGSATSPSLRSAVIACESNQTDVDILLDTLRLPDTAIARLQQAGRDYVAKMLPRDWKHVAALYDGAVMHSSKPAQGIEETSR